MYKYDGLAEPTESPARNDKGIREGQLVGERIQSCGLQGGAVDANVSRLGDLWMQLTAMVVAIGRSRTGSHISTATRTALHTILSRPRHSTNAK